MRINARLDEAHGERLRYLTRATGDTVSEVLKRAIDLYYQQERARAGNARNVLEASGFIGIAEGDEDLSSRYKEALSEDLDRKHGDR
jgi:predicted DNA-binding protein